MARVPIDLKDLIDIVAELCDEEKVAVCFKETLKGAGLAGAGAALFGLLMGPIGLGVGGALGGAVGSMLSFGKFEPASKVLKNMSEDKWLKLYARFRHAFRNFQPSDAAAIVTLIVSGTEFKELAVVVVKNFLTTDLSATIRSMHHISTACQGKVEFVFPNYVATKATGKKTKKEIKSTVDLSY